MCRFFATSLLLSAAHGGFSGWADIQGANYVPSYSRRDIIDIFSNHWDTETVDRELGYAKNLAVNSLRVFVTMAAYTPSKSLFLKNYIALQQLMKKHNLKLMATLKPTGSNCTQDTAFVNAVVAAEVPGAVIAYEADNEPAPWEMPYVKNCTLPALLKASHNPNVDVGVGFAHVGEVAAMANLTTSLNWHSYNGQKNGGGLEGEIQEIQKLAASFTPPKPLVLTEWLARPAQPLVAAYPVIRDHKVAAYHWALTFVNCTTGWAKPVGPGEPPFQGMLWPQNGSAYDELEEAECMRKQCTTLKYVHHGGNRLASDDALLNFSRASEWKEVSFGSANYKREGPREASLRQTTSPDATVTIGPLPPGTTRVALYLPISPLGGAYTVTLNGKVVHQGTTAGPLNWVARTLVNIPPAPSPTSIAAQTTTTQIHSFSSDRDADAKRTLVLTLRPSPSPSPSSNHDRDGDRNIRRLHNVTAAATAMAGPQLKFNFTGVTFFFAPATPATTEPDEPATTATGIWACRTSKVLGCYETKIPPVSQGGTTDQMITRETCASVCHIGGFNDTTFRGVTQGKICKCGDVINPNATKAANMSLCNTPCSANASATCGGSGHMLVYQAECSLGPPLAPPNITRQPPPPSTCAAADVANAPWCDTSLSFEKRAAALVANMTVEEKLCNMNNVACGIKRLHWPKYSWWNEALHGVARYGIATVWPGPISAAAAFNKSLFWQLGDLTSTEARGKAGGLGMTYWAPNVNIMRDPRWGRAMETPGEDPQLSGDYAANFVSGFQGNGRSKYMKASACLKHFSAYSQEKDRTSYPAVVTDQDMQDTYLPAFKAGVQQGNASAIMCSYNAETFGYGVFGNGTQDSAIPSCANKYTLTDLARSSWGFDGYVTGDCGAVQGVQDQHHYTTSRVDTINATISAGVDLDCGPILSGANLQTFIESSKEAAALVDRALGRSFSILFRMGWADPPEQVPYTSYGLESVNSLAHQILAKEASDQAFVLMTNDGALPFDTTSDVKIAVLGPYAKMEGRQLGQTWYTGNPPLEVTPCEGIALHSKNVACVVPSGCSGKTASPCWDSATQAAVAASDAVVLVVGADIHVSHEGTDRGNLDLTPPQNVLLNATLTAVGNSGKKIIILVCGVGVVDLSAYANDPRVSAIAFIGFLGQAGGLTIGDVLFGLVNPSGKLPMTWYDSSFIKAAPFEDYHMRPNSSSGFPGRTHRFYTGNATWKFGHGLSYTRFHHTVAARAVVGRSDKSDDTAAGSIAAPRPAYALLALSDIAAADASATVAEVVVTTTNTGARLGRCSVLVFLSPPNAGVGGRPLQILAGFEKVELAAGEAATVRVPVAAHQLELATGIDRRGRVLPGRWRIRVNEQLEEEEEEEGAHIRVVG